MLGRRVGGRCVFGRWSKVTEERSLWEMWGWWTEKVGMENVSKDRVKVAIEMHIAIEIVN